MSTRRIIANRFEISEKDLVGRGGMGDVYRGLDTQTGQAVAVKVLKPRVTTSHPRLVARFVREGEALSQLNHPNIVKMVAAVEEAGQHYLVMEHVAGGSLRDLLDERKALSIARVVEIVLDLADALTRTHRLDIIHRDLKPGNVLLAQDGTPRLTDFGVAYVAHSSPLTQTGILVGTVDYLSPEACNGEKLDPRSDIWALGVMLYEMLVGGRPFAGETLSATVAAILTQPVPDLDLCCPGVPDALADLVYRMLVKDRHQRIPSVRLVGAELEAILAEVKGTRREARGRAPPATSRFDRTISLQTAARKHNLPAQPTPFVGRKTELAELTMLLADPQVRLVTILGPGGMGKTRLALEAAATHVDRYIHGAYFVSLAPLQAIEAIVPTVAEALDFSFYEKGEPQGQLLDYVRQKNLLLVMDNFEHLLDGVGWVADVLKTAPGVKILATSRSKLNVQGEHLFPIEGLDFSARDKDAARCSAVQLFLTGARRARPGFEPMGDLTDVVRICRLVGGMPLGILLAAAWVEMLALDEIAAQISGEIGPSLDFLETDLRDVPERQRSIRAVFDHSWNLLSEREQQVFQGLSVFCGGFTRQAAQRVVGASLRELMALVNKSLLHRAPTGRYEVHELLRQCAAEKLHQAPAVNVAVRDRHSAYYAAALQEWAADLQGVRQQTALAEMEVESENARAAWNWAVEWGQMERLEQALDGLGRFYEWRGRYQEGERACQAAANELAAGDLASRRARPLWAKIWTWQSVFSRLLGHTEYATQLLQQSLALLESADQDTRPEKAFALLQMGRTTFGSSREQARQLYEQSRALYQALGDRWGAANALDALGWAAYSLGVYDEARKLLQESLAIRQRLGCKRGIANALKSLGLTTLYQGQLEEGERLVQESVAIRREIGDQAGIANGLRSLGGTLVWLGKFAEARSLLEESAALYGDLGFRSGLAFANVLVSGAEAQLGRYEQARAQAQEGLTLAREVGYQRGIGFALFMLGCVALAEGAYAEARELLQESVGVYRAIGQRADLSQALVALGMAARGVGDRSQARACLSEALRTAAEIRAFIPFMLALPAIALLLADQDQQEQAVEIYALASRYPGVARSRLLEDIVGKHIAAHAQGVPPEVVAAAQERGKARDLEAAVAELLVELWDS